MTVAIGTDALSRDTDPWTVEDLADLPHNGQRYEIIDGSLHVTPPPSLGHQGIARRLVAALNDDMTTDWEAVEAVGVLLRSKPSVRLIEPDVVVAPSATLWAGGTTLKPADVALAVEIVSPSSITADRVTKPALLAEAGIPAYWRVEQGTSGPTVTMNRLVGRAYEEERVVQPGEITQATWPVTCRIAPHELVGPRRT